VDELEYGRLQHLEPRQLGAGLYELAAMQKSGATQYGCHSMGAPGGEMRATLGYRRYLDCDKSDTPGQDYAVARMDASFMVGVLADGVGQSFYGNLAADHVSNWLVEELWERRMDPPKEGELEPGLTKAQEQFAKTVENVSLDHLPDWHRAALETTRKAGSQAVFAAFIWEFARERGCLYQVGDAIAMVLRNGEYETILAAPKGRWSSARKSHLQLLRTPFTDTQAILIKSDGADPSWGTDIDGQTADGDQFLEMARVRAENDDVSFLAGCLVQGRRAPRQERRFLPATPGSSASGFPPALPDNTGASALGIRARTPGSEFVATRPESANSSAKPRFRGLSGFWDIGLIFVSGIVAGFLLFAALEILRLHFRTHPLLAQSSSAPENSPVQHNFPANAKEFLADYTSGVVFQIRGKGVAISVVGTSGVSEPYLLQWKGSPNDPDWYVFFPKFKPETGKFLTLRIFCPDESETGKVIKLRISLKSDQRSYENSVSLEGCK
jgi:hypothetical protein